MSLHFNFYRPPSYNSDTQNQLWTAAIADQHDAFCGCTKPISHLLSILFPEGHKDRQLTIQQILQREIQDSQCLFGGQEGKGGGEADTGATTKEEEIHLKEEEEEKDHISDTEIEALLAAAAADDTG